MLKVKAIFDAEFKSSVPHEIVNELNQTKITIFEKTQIKKYGLQFLK